MEIVTFKLVLLNRDLPAVRAIERGGVRLPTNVDPHGLYTADSTPWEQIIDFRADPESRGTFLDLQEFMNESSVLETIIVSGAEMLENFMTLRWSRIAKSLFRTGPGRIAVLEGELTAPGSQVAYILTANKRFDG